jgi:hypothetical protein
MLSIGGRSQPLTQKAVASTANAVISRIRLFDCFIDGFLGKPAPATFQRKYARFEASRFNFYSQDRAVRIHRKENKWGRATPRHC